MSLNETPMAERVHIGFFGLRNAGKSSLVNSITNQEVSLVSDVKGTTTDPVRKSMELLPLGPVTIIDTPGYDDEGSLGKMRVRRTQEVLATCDIAVLVTENALLSPVEAELLNLIRQRGIPYLIVRNKTDLTGEPAPETLGEEKCICVSAQSGQGIRELKEAIAHSVASGEKPRSLMADLIKPGDRVVLVIPIDTSAPKGRLILPQQLVLREILDAGGVSLVTGVETLAATLQSMKEPPALVITDSQVFSKVMHLVPEEIPLTSFSILMARYKGFLDEALKGARAIDTLEDGSKVLICEGCTHHRQCEDIGTVKLPRWLAEYTGRSLELVFTSGTGFPEETREYDLIIHCGGCMLHEKEVRNRMNAAVAAGVPFTNYGTAIAHMNRILARSVAPLQSLTEE